VSLGRKARIFHCGACGTHLNDLTPDQPLGGPLLTVGIFDLFTDGDLETLVQQSLDIIFCRMMWNPAHGDGALGLGISAGKRDLQGFGRDQGIVKK
jgi:hypothetical protein